MLSRVLEPEVMDTPDDAADYDAMDHSTVNRLFVADCLAFAPDLASPVLDVGTGTAQIPIEFCRQHPSVQLIAIDLADEMLKLAAANLARAGYADRVRLERVNGRSLPYPAQQFASVVSNSIIHHIPDPFDCLSEMVRVCRPSGVIFVRDLLRPGTESELQRLVQLYAGDANGHQQQLFAASLRAALTLAEVQSLVVQLGFESRSVAQTSDRHWTWATANN